MLTQHAQTGGTCKTLTWNAKLLMPATSRLSLPVHAEPEAALCATALAVADVAMLGCT